MDTLQAGFQTAPVKLPLTPYQKAVKAREAVADLVQQQMQAVSSSKVRSGHSLRESVVRLRACSFPQWACCRNTPIYMDLQLCSI